MILQTCEPTNKTESAKVSATLVNEFINKSHELWENHPINVKRAKEGKLKAKSLELLKIYIKKKSLNSNSRLFNCKARNLSDMYRHYRNRVADEFNMPELKQVQLYDFQTFQSI